MGKPFKPEPIPVESDTIVTSSTTTTQKSILDKLNNKSKLFGNNKDLSNEEKSMDSYEIELNGNVKRIHKINNRSINNSTILISKNLDSLNDTNDKSI